MEDDAPAIYGLEFQARALASQTAETDAIRFLVGTQSLRVDNQVHLVDYDEESNLINKNAFLHEAGEIWHISSSPLDKNVLATCYNKKSSQKLSTCAALWKMPAEFDLSASDDSSTNNTPSLELLSELSTDDMGQMKCVLWHPSGEEEDILTLTDSHIIHWDNSAGKAKITCSVTLDSKGQRKFNAASWSPHHNSTIVATATEQSIKGWDFRQNSCVYTIDGAHSQLVRDLDYNPNKQYYLVSCGDDCKAKFWDVRNTKECVKTLTDHSHWIWSISYNPFHDQLLLSSSSDSRVILTNMLSISSDPFGGLVDEENASDEETNGDDVDNEHKAPLADGMVGSYDEHEDSVYQACWSAADPWLFASLSYDGRMVINHVPKQIKYQILL